MAEHVHYPRSRSAAKAEVLRGPFDPGGQPEARTVQPLEVSLFAWNVQGGMSANLATLRDPARYRDYWHWPVASRLLREAERAGFDHQLQYGSWSGYGGRSEWAEAALDFATAAAASGAVTERLGIFTTVHATYRFHPLHVAKIVGCLDFVTGGRVGLNVIAGNSPIDFRQFGFQEMPSSEERYAVADEFTTLMKHLWTSEAPIDFEGEYFQAYGASIAPKPVRRPRPPLMNAGQSGPGFDFACRHADWVFVSPSSGRLEDYSELVSRAHRIAGGYGRTVHVAASCYCVMEDTDEEARRTVEYLEENIDEDAVRRFIAVAIAPNGGFDETDPWAGLGRETFVRMGMGMGSFQLHGSCETVAEQLRALHETGVENAVVCFWDPQRGVQQMRERVFPLLKKMKIRV
jgi:FMNH2-dependent dimethyl sulfone monooxygenase